MGTNWVRVMIFCDMSRMPRDGWRNLSRIFLPMRPSLQMTDHTRGPVDTNSQLAAAVENLESAIANSGAEITHGDLPAVAVDGTSLVQIFQNLIGNAIRYRSSKPPRIHIAARAVEDAWLFSCRDNGIGIAPEYHAQIFEPFKRLHGIEIPGSGIGLAVCKKIVERYRGKIWVESSGDEGSIFYFTVPVRFP